MCKQKLTSPRLFQINQYCRRVQGVSINIVGLFKDVSINIVGVFKDMLST